MNLIEIVPAHSREHRRRIRQMSPYVRQASPQLMALVELVTYSASLGIMAAFAVMFAKWWVC